MQRAICRLLRLSPRLALLSKFGSIFQFGCIGGGNEDIELIFVEFFLITIIVKNTVETLFGIERHDGTGKRIIVKDLVEC